MLERSAKAKEAHVIMSEKWPQVKALFRRGQWDSQAVVVLGPLPGFLVLAISRCLSLSLLLSVSPCRRLVLAGLSAAGVQAGLAVSEVPSAAGKPGRGQEGVNFEVSCCIGSGHVVERPNTFLVLNQDLLKARDLDDSIAADVDKELAKLRRQQKAGPRAARKPSQRQ